VQGTVIRVDIQAIGETLETNDDIHVSRLNNFSLSTSSFSPFFHSSPFTPPERPHMNQLRSVGRAFTLHYLQLHVPPPAGIFGQGELSK
jgi:hypothetical protein